MQEPGAHILIVDDERPIRRFLRASLDAHGFQISEAATGGEAIHETAENPPDIIILDLGLPDMDGTEVTRRVREWSQVPIIILSVRDRENDKINALDAGADDYLTKPFSVGELMARIRVALRHAGHEEEEDPVFQDGDLVVDLSRREVTLHGSEVALTPTEYDLLRMLIQKAGKVLTHRQMLRQVWGVAYENETHLLRVNISNLRRKIEADPAQPQYILTEPGVGYRLKFGDA
jgi:two-component system, OmpR family, KDP operon response regulator KdpE